MKTKMNTRGLKKLVITASIAAMLSIGILAQPSPENNSAEFAPVVRLEKLMNSTEQFIKYVAPESFFDDEAMLAVSDKEAEGAIQNLELLTETTEKEIQYKASSDNVKLASTVEKPVTTLHERSIRPVQIESYGSMQDAWLINAGYFKTTRTPAWHKVKKVFRAKQINSEYAEKF